MKLQTKDITFIPFDNLLMLAEISKPWLMDDTMISLNTNISGKVVVCGITDSVGEYVAQTVTVEKQNIDDCPLLGEIYEIIR